jgi:hypothetical protein
MDLIKKIKNNEDFMNKFSYYFDDDQLRFLFIVILIIGFILLFSGIKYAILFWVIGFGLLAFLLIFLKPKHHTIETFICDTLHHLDIERVISEESFGVSMISDALVSENCQIKFRNSCRNKK